MTGTTHLVSISGGADSLATAAITGLTGSSRAKRDAQRALARDIPDPVAVAQYMSLYLVEALLRSHKTHVGIVEVAEADAELLRPYGICEYGGRYLTAHGMAVRAALKVDAG